MYCSDLTEADIAAALWPDLFEGMTGSSNTSAPQGVHEDSVNGYTSTADTGLPNFNASGIDTAFMPTPTPSMGGFTSQSNYSYLENADAWAMPAQAFSGIGPVAPQLVGSSHWTGVSPYATNPAAATPNLVVSPSSSTTPPGSQDELAWPFGPVQSIHHPTFSSFGGGSEGGLAAPEFGANISGVMTYPPGWTTNEVTWPIPGALARSAPTAAPAKRPRHESHGDGTPVAVDGYGYGMPPQKRVKSGKANGILEAARSAPRTRHKTVARIPKQKTNGKLKEAGRGAEMLAIPGSQGIHHRSLLGPSLQQGWAVEAADGQLIWVEGSVEEVAQVIDGTVPHQHQQEVQQEYFEIPKDLKTGYQALLMATQADRARGAVREIKCRLCPDAKFKKWGAFKRHCDGMETHPLTIYFCEHCGDYFARSDSCQRHRENRPAECFRVTPEKVVAKRGATQREHDEFIRRLEGYLTGEVDILTWFSKRIKDMYPDSSKKRRGSKE